MRHRSYSMGLRNRKTYANANANANVIAFAVALKGLTMGLHYVM